MSSELDTVADTGLAAPLTRTEAEQLDSEIRAAADTVASNVNDLLALLDRASAGNIHAALGFPSWTAYVADAVQVRVDNRVERKRLVALMSRKGMSNRAIAGVVGASEITVRRDLDQQAATTDAGSNETASSTTGLDGKLYTRTRRRHRQEPSFPRQLAAVVRDIDRLGQRITTLRDDHRYTRFRGDFDTQIGAALRRLLYGVAPAEATAIGREVSETQRRRWPGGQGVTEVRE